MKFRQLARNYTFRKRYLSIYANELQLLEKLELLAAGTYKKSKLAKDVKARKKYRESAIRFILINLLMRLEPDDPIPVTIDRKRNILSFSDSDCKTFFGFNSQSDLYRLLKCLRLDKDRIVFSNRSVMSGEEILLRGMYELVTGEFQSSVSLNVFGRELTQQSRAFTYFIDHIYNHFCHLLLDNLEWFREKGLLEESRVAVFNKLIDLGYVFERNEQHTIGLFIDCNCLKTCRPGGGPLDGGHDARRYDTLVQQVFYNGWKSIHGLKHQTIDTAHGLTCHLFGPLSLRRNDLFLLGQSRVLVKINDLNNRMYRKVSIFGDSAYPLTKYLKSYVPYELANRQQKEHNKRMKAVRESIEHNYALTKNLFKYISRIEKLKILGSKIILKIYTVCTFLRNCHVLMYGCETSRFFNIILDTSTLLEEYTRYTDILSDEMNVAMEDLHVVDAHEDLEPNVPAITINDGVLNREHLHRACQVVQVNQINREYIPTRRLSLPNIQLGLAQSDIPGAGLGVFLLDDYPAGTKLTIYSGKMLTDEQLDAPDYDTTYVWSDRNNAEKLARSGLIPIIIDANPIYAPMDWGGMINDGLTRESNVTLVRHKNLVYVELLIDGHSGMELYLEYGVDYWKDRYNSVNITMQNDLVTCYGEAVKF